MATTTTTYRHATTTAGYGWANTREAWCPRKCPHWCSIGCTLRILTIIAGCLCILGGVLGLGRLPASRLWIMCIYQIIFGCIMIGGEVPIMYLVNHCRFLYTYEGKGFFLIFVSTFMFGWGSAVSSIGDNRGRDFLDYLQDVCALVLLVKGTFCLLMWLGRYTCCPSCIQKEAEQIAGPNTGV